MPSLIDLSTVDIRPQVVRLVPETLIRQHCLLPIELIEDRLRIAMENPDDLEILDEVGLLTGYQIEPVMASKSQLLETIEKHFSVESSTKQALVDLRLEHLKDSKANPAPVIVEENEQESDNHPVVKLLNSIISGAILKKASDIHLEPQLPEMRVRYRVDGVLHDVMSIPKQAEASLISRAKILSDMDITEKRKAQDGHLSFVLDSQSYDLRLSCIPTVKGEKMVLRILDKSRMGLGLPDLGFTQADQNRIESLVLRPYGIVFVTGPTGSGKTTTLYSILNLLDRDKLNIVTIEDPVEYRLSGINQTQVNTQAGVSFAQGLRSFLRQDPNVIMVGEVRDRETAEIAIQAALTGHLVLSTLHTNDAPSALARLMDMGIEPFLLSSTVNGVIAQRLARTICKECKGSGCSTCFNTGMKGRTVLYEIMEVTDTLRPVILERGASSLLREKMIENGNPTFQDCANEKIRQQLCTEEEVKRVVFY